MLFEKKDSKRKQGTTVYFDFCMSFGDYKTIHHIPNFLMPTLTISVHCFWFFNMLGPRKDIFFSFSPHFLCSSTKRKKENMKIIPIFQKSRKVETDTKTLWQYELCNDHQIKVVILLYMLSTERWKNEKTKKNKATILQKIS